MMRDGRFDEADRIIGRGLTACPDHPELLVDHALSAHNSGRYALAVERWDQAKRVAPHKPMCHAGLAANLRELGELTRARDVMRVGLRRFPSHVDIITEAARLAVAEGRFEEAARFWGRAASRRRAHPDWLQGHAQCLSLIGRFDEAQEVLEGALKRFPSHRGLNGVEGLLAVAREDWPTAIAHWRDFRSLFPDDPTGWEQLGLALQGQALAQAETATPPPAAVPLPATLEIVEDEAARKMLLRFESLGDNCELGLVQRRYGAEPLGLLRWNIVGFEQLLVALAQRFAGMGEAARTELAVAANGEYFVEDRRWHLGMHTFMHSGQTDAQALLEKMCRRVAFLRDKLVADLEAAEKIFVYRSPGIDEARLAALHQTLLAFGPVTVLAVQPAEPRLAGCYHGTPGAVVEVAERCFVGFLSHLGVEEGQTTWHVAFDDWLDVCRRVADAHEHRNDARLAS